MESRTHHRVQIPPRQKKCAENLYRCSPGGIGNALAREFHAKGLRVFATARATETIQDLAEIGIETLSLEVDHLKSINACKEAVKERTRGRLDYLVNNAGRSKQAPTDCTWG